MNFILYFTFCILHFAVLSYSQDTTWRCTYGGAGYDEGRSVIETYDTCYMVAGATGSFGYGDADVYVIKVDRNGSKIWSNVYGGPFTDWGYEIEETFDTCYIIAGYTNSFGSGGYDVYLVKIDRTGKLLWQKTFGGIDWDLGYSLEQTPDSGFVIVGETYSYGSGDADVYLVKTDRNGIMQWQKTYGGAKKDIARSIDLTFDGGFVLAGETWSYGAGENDVYVIKTNASGDTSWTRTFGDSLSNFGNSIIQTFDSNFISVGSTATPTNNFDTYFLKTNKYGTMLWNGKLSGANDEVGKNIIELNDSSLWVVGYTTSFGWSGQEVHLSHFDSIGDWKFGITFGDMSNEVGNSIFFCNNKSLIIVGTTNSYGVGYEDVYLIKLDSSGGPGVEPVLENFDSVIMYTKKYSKLPKQPYLLFVNSHIKTITFICNIIIKKNSVVKIYDVMGRETIVSSNVFNNNTISIDITNLTTGVFIFLFTSYDDNFFIKKFFIE